MNQNAGLGERRQVDWHASMRSVLPLSGQVGEAVLDGRAGAQPSPVAAGATSRFSGWYRPQTLDGVNAVQQRGESNLRVPLSSGSNGGRPTTATRTPLAL
jgi:hypothetical protein